MEHVIVHPGSFYARLAWPNHSSRTSCKAFFLIAWHHSLCMITLKREENLVDFVLILITSLFGPTMRGFICFTLRITLITTDFKNNKCIVHLHYYLVCSIHFEISCRTRVNTTKVIGHRPLSHPHKSILCVATTFAPTPINTYLEGPN